jgi:O-antigen/teichoic acid export membrane protein
MPLFVTLQVDGQEDRAKRFVSDVLPVFSLLWGVLCAFAAVFGSYLLPVLFGPAFRPIESLLWPLMAGAVMVAPVLMGYAPFSSSRSVTYIAMIGAVVAAVVNVILNFFLIPRFGLLGCAWATATAQAMNMIVVVLLVHSRLRVARTWPFWAVIPSVVAAGYASLFEAYFAALLPLLLMSAALILFYRKSIIAALRVLENYGAFRWRTGRPEVSQTMP